MNRRYNATHFWPSEVTSKPASEQSERVSALDEPGRAAIYEKTTQRGRWFMAESKFDRPGWEWEGWETWSDEWAGDRRPLIGVDVSASQFQILAVFCGLTEFEQELAAPNPSLKVTLATQAYHRSRDPYDDFWLPGGFDPSTIQGQSSF